MSTQTETQTEVAPQQITLEDIALIVNIIGAVSRRGAFEASEFTVVGGLFEKLRALLPEPESAPEETNSVETTNTSAVAEIPENQLNFDFGAAAANKD
jgi:hypothetical protein